MVSPPEAIILSTVPFRDITQASLVWEQQGLPEHRRGGATENRGSELVTLPSAVEPSFSVRLIWWCSWLPIRDLYSRCYSDSCLLVLKLRGPVPFGEPKGLGSLLQKNCSIQLQVLIHNWVVSSQGFRVHSALAAKILHRCT